MKTLALALLAILPLAAHAASDFEIRTCAEAQIGIESLDMPLEKNHLSLYDGGVNAYNVDVEEPASRSAGIVFTMPYPDERQPGSQCIAVTFFNSIDITQATPTFDPARGLMLSIPYKMYDPNTGTSKPAPKPLKLLINREKGTIVAE